MFSRWPIRRKLTLGTALLMTTVLGLAVSSVVGVYSYRGLAKGISLRAPELPLALKVVAGVKELTQTHNLYQISRQSQTEWLSEQTHFFSEDEPLEAASSAFESVYEIQFSLVRTRVRSDFADYRRMLENNRNSHYYERIGNEADEGKDVEAFEQTLEQLEEAELDELSQDSLAQLDELATQLPKHLHSRMMNFADNARGKYRSMIGLSIFMGVVSTVLLFLASRMFYAWVFAPLRILVHGSRCVAAGDFGHRIQLRSQDEMAELAQAMNGMTDRFREIRDDLDRQVRQRTKEVVRSEQLASVGFLAAGVAHEINNPLASIALCSESLENRLADIIAEDERKPDGQESEEVAVLRTYLRMIQDEAFRCKQITEKLLDFSRLGDVKKQHTDLAELTHSVIEMISHLGKYKDKQIEFSPSAPVFAMANPQQMKQVVLNLLTNALDSIDPGGNVTVEVNSRADQAELIVRDDGCGMTTEVQEHLFEPFYTRKRDGQGTGLGMSITYRIINDHGGDIQVASDGPGMGSKFSVSLPLSNHDEDQAKIKTAA